MDPGCRQNLIHDPAHTETAKSFRHKILALLTATKDAEMPKYVAFITDPEVPARFPVYP